MKKVLRSILCAATLFAAISDALAAAPMGSVITYQGRLNDGGYPANGSYDLQFALYDAPANGDQIGVTLTNAATFITNGFFTVSLDFGPVFNSSAVWLEVAARSNGNDAFWPVLPRQAITPTPQALFAMSAGVANSVAATNITGTLPSGAYTETDPIFNASAAAGIQSSDVLNWNTKIGLTGPQGPQGEPGPTGATGATGPQGPEGPVGATGATGPQGPQGEPGPIGAMGPQGPQGQEGAIGAMGPQGPQGPQGDAGAAGTSGVDGKTILNGTVAPEATQGADGDFYLNTATSQLFGPKAAGAWPAAVSLVGPTGPAGATGATGPQGPQGEPGPIGAMGPQGPQGQEGAIGAMGPQGPQGPQGDAGAAGVSGADGKTILNGTVAPEATQGVDGDFYLNTATSQLFGPKTAGAWPAAVSLVGPTGPAGATGATGPQGQEGAIGPQGEPGPTGAMGPQGPQGQEGAIGAMGPQGPQGPQGDAGAAGVSGADGKTILNGTVAPEATQGVDGDFYLNTATSQLFGPKAAGAWPAAVSLVGPTGPAGATGATGPQGPQGEPGPIGAMGPQGQEGAIGAMGPQGPQGPQGDAGAAGASGVDGKTILNGTVAPEATQGVDGDFYLNTTTSQLFGPKTAGAWPAAVSLVGPTGPAGATGATGPQGQEGAIGPQGPQGEPGPTGAMGPQGPAGEPGPVGLTGAVGDVGPQGPQGIQGATGPAGASPFSLNGADAVYTAGSVGVGVTSPNGSAALDVSSTAKGFLAPRMTSAQRSSISSPATGLLVYQTSAPSGFYFFDGSNWTGPLGTSGASASPYFSISSALISGNSNGNGTYYVSHSGGLILAERDALRILPFNYTKATLTVAMSGSVSSPYTVTLRRNYSSTVAQCVVNSSSQVTSTATTSFAAGDLVAIQVSGTVALNAVGQQQSLMISVIFE